MKRTFLTFAALLTTGVTMATLLAADLTSEGKSWWAHIQFLADDSLEGRNIGTPGFEKAAQYVEQQFQAIGLKPAGTSAFRQPVKFETRLLVPDQTSLTLVRDGQETPLAVGQDATLSARGELDGATEASMVFVGYGMSIPSANWDDLSKVDLHGKIAVYVNAFPPVKVSDNVKSHVNTADERWAVLKRAGAIGVAIIAAPRPAPTSPAPTAAPRAGGAAPAPAAARGGGGRAGGTPAPTILLADRDLQPSAGEAIAMTLTRTGAAKVLAGTGHSLDELDQKVAAGEPLPTFVLPGSLKARAALKRDSIESTNIVGELEGSDPVLKSEYIIMSAHLDHLGVGRPVNGDAIYNGAMDDASGVASVIEIARLLKTSGVKTRRSILFLTVTAEEKGELGSIYFAAHPTVPFKQIVADINLDMFLPLYALKVIEVQGLAESTLGESVRAAAKTLKVDVQTDREPEQNRFIRSDQYSFIRRGVPALAFKFGYEFGSPDETTRRNWVRDRYHQPSDDLTQPVNLEAAALFDRVISALLTSVANATARPAWHADSYFRNFATSGGQ